MEKLYWFIVVVLVGLFSGCVNYEYTDPSGAKFKASSFLKSTNIGQASVSVMDEKGNGKTFDLNQYQSDTVPLMVDLKTGQLMLGQEGAGQ